MRIAYENGMDELAKTLQEFGHELFPSSLNQECDAILCTRISERPRAGKGGALYVFAKGKTAEELDRIVRSRVYEDIF